MARVNEGSHILPASQTFSTSGVNHTCLYSPATENHRAMAGTHFTVSQRVEGWVDLVGWLYTEIKCRPRESSSDTVINPSTSRAKRRLTSFINICTTSVISFYFADWTFHVVYILNRRPSYRWRPYWCLPRRNARKKSNMDFWFHHPKLVKKRTFRDFIGIAKIWYEGYNYIKLFVAYKMMLYNTLSKVHA